MKKRSQLENDFNEKLASQEFLIKFRGDNEITITGAPVGGLTSRLGISTVGIALVTFCLIIGGDNGYNGTFVIGGSLLGLIIASTPFISFYTRKYYKVYISNRLKQISIMSGVSSPDKRIDFSNIDYLQLKHLQIDDLISGSETESAPSYMHTFMAVCNNKPVELFTLTSQDDDYQKFVSEFGTFLSSFIDKELKVVRA